MNVAEATPIGQGESNVVEKLEEALAKAKAGDLSSVCIIGITPEGEGFTSYAINDVVKCIGLLMVLQHQFLVIEAEQNGRS